MVEYVPSYVKPEYRPAGATVLHGTPGPATTTPPSGTSSGAPAGVGLPTDLDQILAGMGTIAPAFSPYANIISQIQQAREAAKGRITGEYAGLKEETAQAGKAQIAGTEALGARFTGMGLSTFMQGMVQKAVDASDKALARLEREKQIAIDNADETYLGKIADIQMRELEFNQQIRQQQFENAMAVKNYQLQEKQLSPDFLKMKAIFGNDTFVRAGVLPTDSPEEISRKLNAVPLTMEEKLKLDLIRAQIGSANRANQPGAGMTPLSFQAYIKDWAQGRIPVSSIPDDIRGLVLAGAQSLREDINSLLGLTSKPYSLSSTGQVVRDTTGKPLKIEKTVFGGTKYSHARISELVQLMESLYPGYDPSFIQEMVYTHIAGKPEDIESFVAF